MRICLTIDTLYSGCSFSHKFLQQAVHVLEKTTFKIHSILSEMGLQFCNIMFGTLYLNCCLQTAFRMQTELKAEFYGAINCDVIY